MPDTAETEWLDRHATIWLVNSDGSVGRKMATYASGTVAIAGNTGVILPSGTIVSIGALDYQTLEQVTLNIAMPVNVSTRALDPGSAGNQETNTPVLISGIDGTDGGFVVEMIGGTDTETDDQLRNRVLLRIRQPPMGGAASDYVHWALAVPGCTRAWVYPQEQGIGTVAVRVMFDDLRADNGGFPTDDDVAAVQAYIDTVRPVTVKQCYVVAPIPFPCDVNIKALVTDSPSITADIEQSLLDMFFADAWPSQTIYAAWKTAAVQNAPGVISFELVNWTDNVMPSPGYMGVLGDITYVP
jgi:uncharacterized phage protein gp47/JayE